MYLTDTDYQLSARLRSTICHVVELNKNNHIGRITSAVGFNENASSSSSCDVAVTELAISSFFKNRPNPPHQLVPEATHSAIEHDPTRLNPIHK